MLGKQHQVGLGGTDILIIVGEHAGFKRVSSAEHRGARRVAEGRGTGIPKILKVLKSNSSPKPKFLYDSERTFFTIEFPVHPAFKKNSTDQVADQVTDQVENFLKLFENAPRDGVGLMKELGLSHRPTFRNNYLHPALKAGLIEMTIPDKRNSRFQKYMLTEKGRGMKRQ